MKASKGPSAKGVTRLTQLDPSNNGLRELRLDNCGLQNIDAPPCPAPAGPL